MKNIKLLLTISIVLAVSHVVLSVSEFLHLANTLQGDEGWTLLLFVFWFPYFVFVLLAIISTALAAIKLNKYFILASIVCYIIALPFFFILLFINNGLPLTEIFVYLAHAVPFTFFSFILIIPAMVLNVAAFVKECASQKETNYLLKSENNFKRLESAIKSVEANLAEEESN
ncbi:MAG: hypothetical protein LBQ34_00360 [Alphaproteobacteria bacterium]|jgi:hypothetical protein|nr:hypothetical protein [Alphaproteobacteria bacterium]